jgi:hypothetical protein
MLSLLNTTFTTAVRGGVSLVSEILSKLTSRADVIESEDCVKEALRGATARNASFALIPSAYSDGIVHAALPDDGSGDLDFSRVNPAGGTRINSQGVIEKVSLLGDELVTNGTFETVLGNDVFNPNVFYGNPNSVTDGVYEVTVLNTGRGFQMSLLSFELGVDYKIEWEVIETTLTAGVFAVWNGAGGDTTYFGDLTQVGNTGTIYKEGIATQNGDIRGNNLSTGTVKFRLTVKEVIEGYIDDTELVTNGGFDDSSDWSISGESEIVGNAARIYSSAGANTSITHTQAVVAGKTYQVEYDILANVGDKLMKSDGGFGLLPASVGHHTVIVEAVGAAIRFQRLSGGTTDITIDNVSVKEVIRDKWSLGSWAIANGVASSGNTSSLLVQENVYTNSSATYRTTFRARSIDGSSASLRVYDGSGNGYSTLTITSIDFEDFKITRQKAGGDNKLYFYNNSNKQLEIDNVSVKKVIEEGVPRIDHTGGGCPSLLLEPQSTNLIEYSEDFSDSYWAKTRTSVTSGFPSPDGGLNAHLYTPSTAFNYNSLNKPITLASGGTLSLFVKSNGYNYGVINFGASNKSVGFDLSNGTITSDRIDVTNQSIVSMGDGWYRVSVSVSTSINSVNFSIQENAFVNNSWVASWAPNGVDGIYIYGAQLEALPYATSYIPTSGVITTRSAETLESGDISHLINSEEGVLYVEMKALANSGTYRAFFLNDGTNDNRLGIRFANSDNRIQALSYKNTVLQGLVSYTIPNIAEFYKIAFVYSQDNFKLFVNGILIDTDTNGDVFSVGTLNKLYLGGTGGGQNFYGNIKDLRIYKSIAEAQKDLTYIN